MRGRICDHGDSGKVAGFGTARERPSPLGQQDAFISRLDGVKFVDAMVCPNKFCLANSANPKFCLERTHPPSKFPV